MKNIRKLFILAFTVIFIGVSLFGCNLKNGANSKSELTISAAASLKEVMAEIETEFNKEFPNINLTFNFGSSGSLQKQIEQGAPCDVFISAGESQMNALQQEGLLENDSVKILLKNNLVLVTSSKEINSLNDLTTSKVNHIAIGDPASVPAGKYASESLTNLNLLDSVNSKLVFAKDVKEVLSWVASGNAEAGFIYKSDAYNNDSVRVIETISEEYHSPINYPIGIVKNTENMKEAKAFEDFLFTDNAKSILNKYGYEAL